MQFLKNPLFWIPCGIIVSIIFTFYKEDLSTVPFSFSTWLMIVSMNTLVIIGAGHILFPNKIKKINSKLYDLIIKYSLLFVSTTMLLSLMLKK